MDFINLEFLLLLFAALSILFLMVYVKRNNRTNQINKCFFYVLLCILIISLGVITQAIAYNMYDINPIYFEYIIYIGTCFLPVALYFTSLAFSKTKLQYKKYYILLFVIPILSLILLWTNNSHNLFFQNYSFNLNEIITGKYIRIWKKMDIPSRVYLILLKISENLTLVKNEINCSREFSG